jgi:predicted RNA-binding protein with PUA-like domain
MARWILKTEPETYSIADLARDGTTVWDGVANAQALLNLRRMEPGDDALIYHSGTERALVGTARISSAAYPDPKGNDPKHVVVDVAMEQLLDRPVTLATIKTDPIFADSPLVRQPRLSVVPVSEAQWQRLWQTMKDER